mgnify:CR=1 FL=1
MRLISAIARDNQNTMEVEDENLGLLKELMKRQRLRLQEMKS